VWGGTIVPCGQADGRRHMMKSPKMESKFQQHQQLQHNLTTKSQRQQQASDLCRNSSSGFSQPPIFPQAPPCIYPKLISWLKFPKDVVYVILKRIPAPGGAGKPHHRYSRSFEWRKSQNH